jgi:membrane peptidoglycan carboxypeptidase
MRVIRAIVTVTLAAMVATIVCLWLWVRPDVVRVENSIDSAQAPVPERVIAAIVAVEDPDFARRTHGHSFARLKKAIIESSSRWSLDAPVHRASLTERMVGWEMKGRPISRAARQLLVTSMVEWHYQDAQIAIAYANQSYFGTFEGRPIYGVSAASSSYFAKPPDQLSLAELASLVASIRSPGAFSPSVRTERARERRHTVLEQIVSAGLASAAEAAEAETALARSGT